MILLCRSYSKCCEQLEGIEKEVEAHKQNYPVMRNDPYAGCYLETECPRKEIKAFLSS